MVTDFQRGAGKKWLHMTVFFLCAPALKKRFHFQSHFFVFFKSVFWKHKVCADFLCIKEHLISILTNERRTFFSAQNTRPSLNRLQNHEALTAGLPNWQDGKAIHSGADTDT